MIHLRLTFSLLSLPSFPSLKTALLRQTNPNWRALFTLAGPNAKFARRMEAILAKYEDMRLTLLPGHSEVRLRLLVCFVFPCALAIDEYAAHHGTVYMPRARTDIVLSNLTQGTSSAAELDHLAHELESREDCAYGTVTSGDNIYGSEVVQNILFAHKNGANGEVSHSKEVKEGLFAPETEANVPKIVFVPYDSRANAEYGKFLP